jgi:hypothetical protein
MRQIADWLREIGLEQYVQRAWPRMILGGLDFAGVARSSAARPKGRTNA